MRKVVEHEVYFLPVEAKIPEAIGMMLDQSGCSRQKRPSHFNCRCNRLEALITLIEHISYVNIWGWLRPVKPCS